MIQSLCPSTLEALHIWVIASGALFGIHEIIKNLCQRRPWSSKAVFSCVGGTSAPTFLFLTVAPLVPETIKLLAQDAVIYLFVAGFSGLLACADTFLTGWEKQVRDDPLSPPPAQ